MRAILVVVAVLTAVWCGYWFVGSSALERGAAAAFADRRDQGWTATYQGLAVRGFPSRFDLTVDGLDLADPESGLHWTAPFVQVLALSYAPNEVIVAFPDTQVVSGPFGALTIGAQKLQASAAVTASTDPALDRTVLIGEALTLTAANGQSHALDNLLFATRRETDPPFAHRIGLDLKGLRPDAGLMAALDPDSTMAAMIDLVHLDAEVALDRPIDRHLADAPPVVTRLDLTELRLDWGPSRITASGPMTVGADGFVEGVVKVRIRQWRPLLALSARSGGIGADDLPAVERLLALVAATSGEADTLELPLIFAGGQTSLGPVRLGLAPRLGSGARLSQ